MRDRIPVVVQGSGRRVRRVGLAGVLWACAEAITTVGVVVALLVVHQVWWTNRQAAAAAREQVQALESEWAGGAGDRSSSSSSSGSSSGSGFDSGSGSGAFSSSRASSAAGGDSSSGEVRGGGASASSPSAARPPVTQDRAYAVLRIPRLGLVVPVAQGVDKRSVLDKGYVGQYPGTARPGERGNFALAGHRNTHGEPFRYINRLREGDQLIVDVKGRRYTYVVGKVLAETTERDTGVIAPVPRSIVKPDYGYGEAGSYITLTTCTPEYTSKYRLVVWGTLAGP